MSSRTSMSANACKSHWLRDANRGLVSHVPHPVRSWEDRGNGTSGNLMDQIAMFQDQTRKQQADAERRMMKLNKVEQSLNEGKDTMWRVCSRLAQVPGLAHVVGRGITVRLPRGPGLDCKLKAEVMACCRNLIRHRTS